MTEARSGSNERRRSSFNLPGFLIAGMFGGGAILAGVHIYQDHQQSTYEAFDPSKEADLIDKVHADARSGGLKYWPGMPNPMQPDYGSDAENTLVFGQIVKNGKGEKALAVCKLAVSEALFKSHEENERIAPDQVQPGCQEIPSLRQPLAEAVKTWPQLQTPTPN